MKWKQALCPKSQKPQEYGIVSHCGRFHIAKALVDGEPRYTLWDVIEHVADKPAFVAQLAAQLEAGGLMVLSTPNRTAKSRLLLVGAGPMDESWRAAAAKLPEPEAVIFTGRVPHQDVNRYYDLIDVLAYPRKSMRLTELVTPLKPLEAMAQGKLFVASDVGGHRELIRNDETGYLFRAGDAADLGRTMARVLDQPEKWDAIRAAGRRFVESERNWRTSVARYRGVFSTLAPAAA